MADNTLQFQWIVTIKEGLARAFAAQPDVFVAGDLLWYPVEGRPDICAAPDAMRRDRAAQGYRGCYKQWEEGGIAPQVVFEVLSPNNRPAEMGRKLEFYEQYGVDEYYIYDPDHRSTERLAARRRRPAGDSGPERLDQPHARNPIRSVGQRADDSSVRTGGRSCPIQSGSKTSD